MVEPPRRRPRSRRTIETGKKKEFTFRGMVAEELRELPMEQLMPLLDARARRTLKRGLKEKHQHLADRAAKSEEGAVLRTHLRDMLILPTFVGRTFAVHNGKDYARVDIQPEMVGHYLGEFVLTRKSVKHTGPGVGATRGSKFLPLK